MTEREVGESENGHGSLELGERRYGLGLRTQPEGIYAPEEGMNVLGGRHATECCEATSHCEAGFY